MKNTETEHKQNNKLRVPLNPNPNEETQKQRSLHLQVISSKKTDKGKSLVTSQIDNLGKDRSIRSKITKTLFSSSALGKKNQKALLKPHREKRSTMYYSRKRFHRDIFKTGLNTELIQFNLKDNST